MRYDRNGIFTEEEIQRLGKVKVCIIGCGGLGGYILEMMARIGIGHITVIDGDVFNVSNLNRQILSTETNIGQSKVNSAKERMTIVNSEISVSYIDEYLNEDNAQRLLEGHDLVMDALDSITTRFLLQEACHALGIPFVHGAIAGWYGQVSVVFPGDKTLDLIYASRQGEGVEKKIGNPSFTPSTIASIQVSEGLKVLLNKGEILRMKLLYVDLLQNEFHIMNL
jgi:molybdopterin/thiamine biosynthesis adenylyltransferase